ncbi:C-C motif chemokine 17 [Dipodomys merriami]|uniref:C-C motif chemokine 17 n=1 Tax=Dipodomys merriami TaxID=94247 RepID=UPI003855CB66
MMPLKMLLLTVLLLEASLQHVQAARAPNAGRECCMEFFKGAIPIRRLVAWYRTSAECPKDAIVLVTIQDKYICSDPKARHTMKAVRYLESLRKSQASESS